MLLKSKGFLYSITFQVIVLIFLLLLPVVFLSGYINHRFMRSGIQQIEQSHVRLLESYMSQVDHEMEMAQNYINSLTFYNSTTIYLTDRNSPNFYYAVNTIRTDIPQNALYYRFINCIFLYVPDSNFLYTHAADTDTLNSIGGIEDFIKGPFLAWIREDTSWYLAEIGGATYLIKGFYSNGLYGGVMLNTDRLPMELELGNGQEIGFCSPEQLLALEEAAPDRSTLLSAASGNGPVCVYEFLAEEDALSSLPFLLRYLQVVTLFMVLLIPLAFLAIRKLILQPLHYLTNAMEQVETGDLETQITQPAQAAEFQQINQTFNHMTGQIKDLKIAVYEEQLETQRTKLQNLSYQLRPHFMINTLNMAYNMIYNQDYSSASRLMEFSASYMRYLLKTGDDFVLLQDEIDHLDDYMGIQLLRYKGQFVYEKSVDPMIDDIRLPNMILQNFLENSIKYSLGPNHMTRIELCVKYVEPDGVPCASVMVRDDGAGYPAWLLEALTARDLDTLRDRVGLRNTLQRVQMLYGDEAQCRFYNDNGAVSEFIFPLDMDDE